MSGAAVAIAFAMQSMSATPATVPFFAPVDADAAADIAGPALPQESAAVIADPASQASAAIPSDPQDIVITGHRGAARGDPLERVNEKSFAATQAIDGAIIGPVAMAYAKTVPNPIRSGLRNFRFNLHEPIVFVNFLLQHKVGKAGETLARFAINSTIGAVGVLDIAKRRTFRLPRRRNGFGDTMGFYGIKPGPYFFLPLIGPTTARDLLGTIVDNAALPLSFLKPLRGPAYTIPTRSVTALDHRAEFDEELQTVRQAGNPYAARRTLYLARRQAEIDHLRGVDAVSRRSPAGAAGVVVMLGLKSL